MLEAAVTPFVAKIDCGRAAVTAALASAFPSGQCPIHPFGLVGFFLCIVFPCGLISERPSPPWLPPGSVIGAKAPDVFVVFPSIPPLTNVPLEDVEEFEDREDEELDRCALLRGMNMALTSSFMELSEDEPLELHPERVCGG